MPHNSSRTNDFLRFLLIQFLTLLSFPFLPRQVLNKCASILGLRKLFGCHEADSCPGGLSTNLAQVWLPPPILVDVLFACTCTRPKVGPTMPDTKPPPPSNEQEDREKESSSPMFSHCTGGWTCNFPPCQKCFPSFQNEQHLSITFASVDRVCRAILRKILCFGNFL